ncbi:hypothetical protein [Paenibacillus brasilensis]|uniref:Integrase catalytic domain-containing protein n=1 Tax=Paenibacillus brasilensis TaxID=128574 RepID=A0ABU0L7P6_9BACL|nr:hypothetical protein [Paenibacillus brasilensis]MDQ0497326.1 hypothetical protein [Paenibacillus brasilensis]
MEEEDSYTTVSARLEIWSKTQLQEWVKKSIRLARSTTLVREADVNWFNHQRIHGTPRYLTPVEARKIPS